MLLSRCDMTVTVLPAYAHVPVIARIAAREYPGKRRFARSAFTHDSRQMTGTGMEINLIQNAAAPIIAVPRTFGCQLARQAIDAPTCGFRFIQRQQGEHALRGDHAVHGGVEQRSQ